MWPMRWRRWQTSTDHTWPDPIVLLIGGVLPLATLLCLLFLGRKSLWLDEAFSVLVAQREWGAFWRLLYTEEANMGLYYVLLRLWVSLGTSEFAVRALSVIFAVGTVPLVYALGTRLFGARAGLIGALLLAVNAFYIWYAQEARGYSLLLFLVTLSSLLYVRCIERPSLRNWAGYVLASVLATYTHFFAALVLAAHLVSLAFMRPRAVPWKGLLLSTLTICVLLLPLGAFILARNAGQVSFLPQPGVDRVYLLTYLTGAFPWIDRTGARLLLLAYGIFCSTALLSTWRTRFSPQPLSTAWPFAFLLAWLIVPVILVYGISLVQPIFGIRYFIILLPALVLLAAVGISQMRSRLLLAGALAAVSILSVRAIFFYYAYPTKWDWRGAVRYIISQAEPGDALLFNHADAWVPYDYYRTRVGDTRYPTIVFPPRGHDIEPAPALFEDLASRYTHVWLLLMYGEDNAGRSMQASLARSYALKAEKKFVGLTILTYKRGK
jgi:mannosyltransferase